MAILSRLSPGALDLMAAEIHSFMALDSKLTAGNQIRLLPNPPSAQEFPSVALHGERYAGEIESRRS